MDPRLIHDMAFIFKSSLKCNFTFYGTLSRFNTSWEYEKKKKSTKTTPALAPVDRLSHDGVLQGRPKLGCTLNLTLKHTLCIRLCAHFNVVYMILQVDKLNMYEYYKIDILRLFITKNVDTFLI